MTFVSESVGWALGDAGAVWAAFGSCGTDAGNCNSAALHRSAVGNDAWERVDGVEFLPHRSPTILARGEKTFVAAAATGGVALFVSDRGAPWQRLRLPCSRWGGAIGAANASDLVAACQTAEGAGGQAPHDLHVSSDGGGSWQLVRRDAFQSYPGQIAATPAGTFFLVQPAETVTVTRDGGRSFQDVVRPASSFGFTSAKQGFAIAGGAAKMTRDGGATWEDVRFSA